MDAALRSQTLTFSEEREKTILLSAIKKRKMSSLQKLKQLATERQYLSEMMKKYAGILFLKKLCKLFYIQHWKK